MATRDDKDPANASNSNRIVGWREWVALPDLGIRAIKAKLDTGARTSALHAFAVERFSERGVPHARLQIHPLQRNKTVVIETVAPIIDERVVSDSGGHREKRIVVSSMLVLGEHSWPIELTVTDRDTMLFRLLLGRTAMAGRIIVDSAKSYVIGKRKIKEVKKQGALS